MNDNIKTIFQKYNDAYANGDISGLMECANQLATLRYNVLEGWSNAKSLADRLDSEYKLNYDAEFLDFRGQDMTLDEARARARLKLKNELMRALDAQKDKTYLTGLRDDLATKISVIQSTVKTLENMRLTKEL